MSNPENLKRAFFKIEGSDEEIPVHFNPETLQYTISNNIKNLGEGSKKKQFTSESTAKLSMDLIFDTTGSGEDVRLHTVKIAKFMKSTVSRGKRESDIKYPVVNFEWGLYTFKGMVESYKETIDFFSAEGVPLRASVNITMSKQDEVFEVGKAGTERPTAVPNETLAVPTTPDTSVTDLASKAGNPEAARMIAAINGLENMRFPGKASLEIGGSASLRGPTAFATGGSGLSASTGAFSALHTKRGNLGPSARLRLGHFMKAESTAGFGTDDQDSFCLGGASGLKGSASLKAALGTAGEFKSKIEFEEA